MLLISVVHVKRKNKVFLTSDEIATFSVVNPIIIDNRFMRSLPSEDLNVFKSSVVAIDLTVIVENRVLQII